ncbi:MAG: 4Fe-4S binding protein [Methanomethylovorans sp.]|jgi:4Fe-4S ferredoxin|nr:4Fe-4S binding protein [Methanomethylovorans sp.]
MTDERDEQSMYLEKEMDVDGTHFIYRQISDRSKKVLEYDYKRCIGCGICVGLCPTKALELGPMKEIAMGLDVPPVIMDLDKCTFCSMCVQFCPLHAYTMTEEGDFPSQEKFPQYDDFVRTNEKCLPCSLCEAACPEDAIVLELEIPTKAEVSPFKEGMEGQIEIDTEKCNLCGLCARFCDAFLLVEKEKTPTDVRPFEQLLVDEEKCDYCTLCQDICPEDAIRVEGEKRGEAPSVKGKIVIDDNKCTRCTWCRIVCPYDAMDIKKPFEGKINLIASNVNKCDPQGCHGCFNVCPSHLWFVSKDGKIAIQEDMCIYCGACVNACPKDVMSVERYSVHHTEIPDSPWAKQWKDAIESLITGKRHLPEMSRTLEVEPETPREHMEVELPIIDGNLLSLARLRLEKVTPVFRSVSLRRMLESSKETEPLRTRIKEEIFNNEHKKNTN